MKPAPIISNAPNSIVFISIISKIQGGDAHSQLSKNWLRSHVMEYYMNKLNVVSHSDGLITIDRLQYFDVNQTRLKEEHKYWLRKHVLPILQAKGSVSLVGLASRSGRAPLIRDLSTRRANAVKDFLEECQQSSFKFDLVEGYGEELARDMGQSDGYEDGHLSLPLPD